MSTSVVFYPHAIYIAGLASLTQIDSVMPIHGFEDLLEWAAGQVGPMYSGTHQGKPGLPFRTTQLKDILDLCVAGIYNCSRDVSGDGNVDLELKAGDNLNAREADANLLHIRGRMTANAMVTVESITCRQGGLAEASIRVSCIYKTATGVDPLVFTNTVALSVISDVSHLFTLGPIKLNGSFIEGVQEWTLNNNIEYDVVWDGGFGFPAYCGIKKYAPQLSFMARDARIMNTFGTRGTALSALSFWNRKKVKSGFEVADATEEHIKYTATTGTIKARSLGDNTSAEVTVDMTMADQDTPAYAIDTTAAIA